MEEHEVYARCCFKTPVCSYRIRSWCNRWLSCAGRDARFASSPAQACQVLLLPSSDGRYEIELYDPKLSKAWVLCSRDGCIGWSARQVECFSEDSLFSLQVDESGSMSVRGGNGYLTTDRSGCVWIGPTSPRKWEMFTLHSQAVDELPEDAPWVVQAPVRVTLQTSNGQFLCAAKTVVTARAEAPCCCEEFLLDLRFSSLPPPNLEEKRKPRRSLIRAFFGQPNDSLQTFNNSYSQCTIRTADGACMLTAGTDGNIYTTPLNCAQGRETFSIDLLADIPCPRISIRQTGAERRYLSAEFGHLVNRRAQRRSCDYFNIQLASGSRVLLKSIHGGFLGACTSSRCSIISDEKQSSEGIGAWQLRAHGDSLYTLTCASTTKRGPDIYVYADASGRIYQSSNPRVHFPAVASLFEIKPFSIAGVLPKSSMFGFTIRTVRKINGKQRYLSVEPNGSVKAVKLTPSWWEVFQLIDVDATAAAVAPQTFSCFPASLSRETPSSHGSAFSRGSFLRADTTRTLSSERCVKACAVAAMAVTGGQGAPRKSPASLQELCITQVCSYASPDAVEDEENYRMSEESEESRVTSGDEEFSELVSALCSLARSHELLPLSIPSDFITENSFTIPDDLLTRIWSACRSRQVPKSSCKWSPSAFLPHSQGPRRFAGRADRTPTTDGWHCNTCDQGNVLPMDAKVNPAHHRYLEMYSRAVHSTGVLWNLISLAGVSIMSTALFCQLKAVAGRRHVTF